MSKAVPTILLGLAVILSTGCEKEERRKQVGPLKDWIVGDWKRQDDPNFWNFSAAGEMNTTGRVPIGGSYEVIEPDQIKVTISGAGASTASMMLGVPLHENKNLYLTFVVQDDEMRPIGISSATLFRKRKP